MGWTWVHSEEEVSESYWGSGSPSNMTGNSLDCGYMELRGGSLQWRDGDCGDHEAHGAPIAPVCQRGEPGTSTSTASPSTTPPSTTITTTITTTTSPVNTTTAVKSCPLDWSRFEESCYWVYLEQRHNHLKARDVCLELGA